MCLRHGLCADVYTFVRTLLKLLIVLSFGPVRLPSVCFINVAWLRISVGDPFTCWAPPHSRLVGLSLRLGIGVRVNGMPASTGLQDRAHVAPRRYSHPNTSLCSPDGDSLVSALHSGFVKSKYVTFTFGSARGGRVPIRPTVPPANLRGGLLPSDGRWPARFGIE